MEPSRQIIDFLHNLRKRSHRQVIIHHVTLSILWVMFILALVFIGVRFIPIPYSITIGISILIFSALLFSIVLSFFHRKSIQYLAHHIDRHQELKERVSTALNLIEENRVDEVAQQQIHNTSECIADLNQQIILPYSLPKSIKWLPIPLLIIGISFAIPRQYSLPEPPSAKEQLAMDSTYKNLESMLNSIKDQRLKDEINETIGKLRNVEDVPSAQEHLRELNRFVQEQKSKFPDEATIQDATQATQNFKGMNADDLANEFDKLLNQPELTPELNADIKKLLKKLSESMPEGVLNSTLQQAQTEAVTEETLQEILNSLEQLNQLDDLEKQLTESRKDIALAGLDFEQTNGGLAKSDSAAGDESGSSETQGTLVNNNTANSSKDESNVESNIDNTELTEPLTGDQTPSIGIDGKELRLNSNSMSDINPSTRVFNSSNRDTVSESNYLPFSDVVLNAQREYAQAIQTNRIPVKYRKQIKAYLEAINKINE